MYAIVETGGRQYRVATGDKILVDRVKAEIGDTIEIGRVLLLHGDEVKVGAPLVDGAKVVAKVVGHSKGEKKITFKYRRTRRYRLKRGFRHSHTELEILDIAG
ncbi:MAG: 50S ribosomal protein L21 [Myxococcota bacterium]